LFLFLNGDLNVSLFWRDPAVDGRIIIRWILKKWDVGIWTGFCWFRLETGGGHL
jgi:hypothetical protein